MHYKTYNNVSAVNFGGNLLLKLRVCLRMSWERLSNGEKSAFVSKHILIYARKDFKDLR